MPTLKKNTIRRPWQAERIAHGGRLRPNSEHYNSAAYKRDRFAFMSSKNWLCEICAKKGLVVPATHNDHKVPINQGGSVWGWSNRQCICKTCHDSKSGSESRGPRHTDTGKWEGG